MPATRLAAAALAIACAAPAHAAPPTVEMTWMSFKDDAMRGYLEAQKIALYAQTQYFDKFVLSPGGLARDVNHDVKSRLGFADAQKFSQSLLDAVEQVASTSVGDDCGEGFLSPSPWEKAFAALDPKSQRSQAWLPPSIRDADLAGDP